MNWTNRNVCFFNSMLRLDYSCNFYSKDEFVSMERMSEHGQLHVQNSKDALWQRWISFVRQRLTHQAKHVHPEESVRWTLPSCFLRILLHHLWRKWSLVTMSPNVFGELQPPWQQSTTPSFCRWKALLRLRWKCLWYIMRLWGTQLRCHLDWTYFQFYCLLVVNQQQQFYLI